VIAISPHVSSLHSTTSPRVIPIGVSGRGPWPYVRPDGLDMPATLPDGKPWPRISIVTPTYNQGQYIEQTILSVLNQGYPNLQYMVMDGASTDDTMQVVERYRSRIDIVVSEKDKGQSSAINKGMALADGELVSWLNSDDMLAPGALHALALAFYTSGADIVTGVTLLQKDGETTGRHLTSCPSGPLTLRDLLDLENCWQQGQFWYQPETMFTRALWETAGAHVKEDIYYSMDYELWLRFAERGAVLKVIGRPIALYRVHENQKTYNPAEFRPELEKVRESFVARASRPCAVDHGRDARATRSKLKLVFFNDLGSVAGAGIAHQRLAAAAALAGHDVIPLAIKPAITKTPPSASEIVETIAKRSPDIVFVGNLHSANIDPNLPGQLAQKFPTIQVLHDLWPLTGRCAYPGDCTAYFTGCDEKCPTRNEYPIIPAGSIRTSWEDKYRALTSSAPPIIAGVSHFTEEFARSRFAGAASAPPIISFRYGLDTTIFKPRDRATCREMLSLPADKFIILFSANHLSEKRKGLHYLLEALARLNLPDILAVCIGHFDPSKSDQSQIPNGKSQVAFRSMGYINDPYSLSTLYSACDLFVGPSQIETFGQVFIEAAACGTPSVAFRTGGVPEALCDGISGILAGAVDAPSLAAAIDRLYRSPALRQDLSRYGRVWIENEFSLASAAHRMFSQLREIGVTTRLGLAPNLTLTPTSTPRPLEYLAADGAVIKPSAAASSNGAFGQLQMKIAALEAERNALRKSLTDVTSTRLWRWLAKIYPMYASTIDNPRLPAPIRNSIASVGRALSKKKT
jgi:glycosyltransferase involved in cell wall biosynthesis